MSARLEPIGNCHAGGGHRRDARNYGKWGELCSDCIAWVERFRARLAGKAL